MMASPSLYTGITTLTSGFMAARRSYPGAPPGHSPDVGDRLVGDQAAVFRMRRRDDQQVGPVQHLGQRGEPVVGDVRVRAQRLARLEDQDLAQLVRQALPRVVAAR